MELGLAAAAGPHHRLSAADRHRVHDVDALLAGRWDRLASALAHLTLPAVTLAVPALATVVRFTRAGVLDTLQQAVRHLPGRHGHPARPDRLEVRAAQRADLHRDPDRPAVRHPARRRRRDRDGVRVAGHRHLRLRGDPAVRLRGRHGLHGLCGRDLHAREPAGRHRPRLIDPAEAAGHDGSRLRAAPASPATARRCSGSSSCCWSCWLPSWRR